MNLLEIRDPFALSEVEVQPLRRIAFDCAQAERSLDEAGCGKVRA
jgi:hypothetical protein